LQPCWGFRWQRQTAKTRHEGCRCRPAPLAAIALQNRAVVYDILFKAAAETVRTIGADPKYLGAETGMIAILHSWGQTLTHHPHVHCIVPGGGLAPDGRWVACRPGFFLPVHVLSRLYRRLFLERLFDAFDAGKLNFFGDLAALAAPIAFARYLAPLRRIAWVVYVKRPFGGAEQVLDYLGRYTHRVAIANSRLLACEDDRVCFQWKDYRARDKAKTMTLAADEFIRRFLLHVLPNKFAASATSASSLTPAARPSWHASAPRSRFRSRPRSQSPPIIVSVTLCLSAGGSISVTAAAGRMVEVGFTARTSRAASPDRHARCDTS
jgi:Putative transposase